MSQTPFGIGRVITYAGAFIAFLIGAGFATGQEVMQYFTSYGFAGVAGILVVFLLFLYVAYEFVAVGYRRKLANSGDVYRFYCGRWVGGFFDYFSILFIYLSFVVMLGGAGATVSEHYGIQPAIGAVLLGTAAALTVVTGLSRVVEVVGKIGPLIVVLSISLGAWALLSGPQSLGEAESMIPALQLKQVSSAWYYAAFSYVGFCMLWLAGFMGLMGSNAASLKEVGWGAVLGAVGFSLALLVVALGFMSNIEYLAHSEVPMLKLAAAIHPAFATLFSLIVLAGIYTTAVPLLWQAAARFTGGQGNGFRLLTFVLTAVGILISLFVPFSKLMGYVYEINGYVGFILLFFMLVHTVRRLTGKA